MPKFRVGDLVRVHGRTGTVVEVSEDRHRPHVVSVGVVFGSVNENGWGTGCARMHAGDIAWFDGPEAVGELEHAPRPPRAEAVGRE